MGSRIAPTLAIVFMGSLEKHFLTNPTGMQPDSYMRYIDDAFAVDPWRGELIRVPKFSEQ